MTNAVHTSDIMVSEVDEEVGSGACGYIIETEDDLRVYFAGDTGVFGDMKIIADLYYPHLIILPIGGKYNMGVREAAYATFLLRPRILVPSHYDTFPDQIADLKRLKELTKEFSPSTELVILKPSITQEFSL